MKKTMFLLAACVLSISTMGMAKAAEKESKPIGQWTCQDFLMLDESFRPTAVAFVEGVTKKDPATNPTLNVQGIEKVVPVIVQECSNNHDAKFMDKVKMHLNDPK